MQDNILSFIGLARKSGSLELGAEKAYDLVETSRSKLVLLAENIAANTEKSVRNTCNIKGIPVVKTNYKKEDIGPAVGLLECGVLTVTNTGFACSIADKLNNEPAKQELSLRLEREKRRFSKKKMKSDGGKRKGDK